MRRTIFAYQILILAIFSINISIGKAQLKNPKVESQKTVEDFLKKTDAQNNPCLITRFDKLASTILAGISPTSVYVFDKAGNNLKLPGEKNKCALDPALFIGNLKSHKTYEHSSSFPLDSMYSWYMKLNNDNFQKQNNKADYFIFITWAIWPGIKIFKRDIQSCIDAVNKNKTATIELTLINLDAQSSWGEENLKKIKLTKQSIELRY